MGGVYTPRWCKNPWEVQMYRGCINIRGHLDTPKVSNTCLPLRKVEKTFLKLNSYNLQAGQKNIEPPDYTENEPTQDIPIEGSGQDIKKEQNGKYMPFVRTC